MKEIVDVAKRWGGDVCDGFQDTDLGEIQKLIETIAQKLTEMTWWR